VPCERCGRETLVAQLCEYRGSAICAACLLELDDSTIFMRPVGVVHNDLVPGTSTKSRRNVVSQLVLGERFLQAMTGISVGDRLLILFALEPSGDPPLLQYPQGDRSRGLHGVFSLRSQNRPNPIGLTSVIVVAVDEESLLVRGLDAWDGTPLLDIKPHVPMYDD